MSKEKFQFEYEVHESIDALNKEDAALLLQARENTANAYAPYSHFDVSAVARLENGEIVFGTNQENASYPVGICAERSLLSVAATLFKGIPIQTMAITYHNIKGDSNSPVSPCGMCRQALREYEERMQHPIRLILSGMTGQIFVIENVGHILPFSFGSKNLDGLS